MARGTCTYRTGPRAFAAVGLSVLGSRDARRLDGGCSWAPLGSRQEVPGELSAWYPGEHHDLKYETVVLHCNLFWEPKQRAGGGRLAVTIDGRTRVVLREPRGAPLNPAAPFAHNVTFCSPPIYGSVRPEAIHEWVEFHFHQGVDHMVMYDAGGVDRTVAALLALYVKLGECHRPGPQAGDGAMSMLDLGSTCKRRCCASHERHWPGAGRMEIVDMRHTAKYETWLYSQVMLMNDCAYRTRFTTKWAIYLDFDEYWQSDHPTRKTIPDFLTEYEGKAYVTFGSMWWGPQNCVPEAQAEGPWMVQRMFYHWPEIYCVNKERFPASELCLDYWGHRKYAVDPRRVFALQIHRTEIPQQGGVDVDAKVAKNNHFQGILKRNGNWCTEVLSKEQEIVWWARGSEIADLATKARRSPVARLPPGLLSYSS
eukprot:SM000040S14801  [mRNA]  locus=s40:392448:395119:- [translate_table: standard]